MSWALRRATATDADLLAEHRSLVWQDAEGYTSDELAPQVRVWRAWLAEALADGTYVGWIALDAGGAVVGSAGLVLRVAMPRPHFPVDRDGRVQSVYVVPAMRRRGIARALMAGIIAYARDTLLMQLTLHPSEEGRALYAALGFVPIDELALRFDAP